MFASNFPVDSLCATFATIFDGFREIVRDFRHDEQRALFHDNAIRIYGMNDDDNRLGYVGIGLMGLPMTKRLLSPATRSSRTTSSPARSRRAGRGRDGRATRPPTLRAAPISVLLNLPTTDAVEAGGVRREGVASAMQPPQLVVDFSTIKVDNGQRLRGAAARTTGCGWVDAPVSGGPPASATGTLTVMAGGDDGRHRARARR